ncbi:ComF family protein [Sphingopyxis sp.]|uniref:ComF family protein n=1 Tax=Sphingopyxis sp. TaxID=1908224 RepID=UPI003D6D48C0
MAISLEGKWHSGLAFDLHTISSTHLGVDEFGHDRFENTRSEMGELVYQLKYRYDKASLSKIVSLLDKIKGIEKFDYIAPIPPTNKKRPFQPVELIAHALGERRGVKVVPHLFTNDGDEELKGISDPVERVERLQKAIKLANGTDVSRKKILLVDDLYRSGTTLRVVTDLLYDKGKAEKVSVLTMTKTRSNR